MEKHYRCRKITHTIVAFFAIAGAQVSAAATLHVCKTCAVKSIGQALSAASANDTVLVEPGEYFEANLLIDKPLQLLAASGAVTIDGQNQGNVIFVHAHNVEISGLRIRNSGFSYTDDFAGIKVMDSSHCAIRNNSLENNYFGIYLGRSEHCTIENNQVTGLNKRETDTGNGIHIWYGKHMIVAGNATTANRDGIYFEFVSTSAIYNNKSYKNLRYGLHFMFSNDNSYSANVFEHNDSGVAVMYSRRITMLNNRFISSLGPASYGILLKDISEGLVSGNVIANNTLGIFLEGTTRCQFLGNTFSANGWALRVLGDTDSNHFAGNDFLANTFDVSTNATMNLNTFAGNYWSHYKGIDINRDHIGDDPYYPVQLSSLLMERYKISVVLINSFFFQLLDEVERVLPILTPAEFNDPKPRMRRVTHG